MKAWRKEGVRGSGTGQDNERVLGWRTGLGGRRELLH